MYFETRLDLECSSSSINKHLSCKNFKQLRLNRNILNALSLWLWHCLLAAYLLNAGLEHSRCDLVFKQSRWLNYSVFVCPFSTWGRRVLPPKKSFSYSILLEENNTTSFCKFSSDLIENKNF